jgi:hypothetical protein
MGSIAMLNLWLEIGAVTIKGKRRKAKGKRTMDEGRWTTDDTG